MVCSILLVISSIWRMYLFLQTPWKADSKIFIFIFIFTQHHLVCWVDFLLVPSRPILQINRNQFDLLLQSLSPIKGFIKNIRTCLAAEIKDIFIFEDESNELSFNHVKLLNACCFWYMKNKHFKVLRLIHSKKCSQEWFLRVPFSKTENIFFSLLPNRIMVSAETPQHLD